MRTALMRLDTFCVKSVNAISPQILSGIQGAICALLMFTLLMWENVLAA